MGLLDGIIGGKGPGGGYSSASSSGSTVNATASSDQGNRSNTQSDAPVRSGPAALARHNSALSDRRAPAQQLDFASRSGPEDGIDTENAAALIEAQSEEASTPDRLAADRVQKVQSFQSISQSIRS